MRVGGGGQGGGGITGRMVLNGKKFKCCNERNPTFTQTDAIT